MPNPVRLLALDGAKVWSERNASQQQRISLTKDGESKPRHVFEVPNTSTIPLETGYWWVLHETVFNGQWMKGLGRNNGDYRAEFDDNPYGQGDNDYNDAIVRFLTDI